MFHLFGYNFERKLGSAQSQRVTKQSNSRFDVKNDVESSEGRENQKKEFTFAVVRANRKDRKKSTKITTCMAAIYQSNWRIQL